MGNRATARLMFGAVLDMDYDGRTRLARVIWPQFLGVEAPCDARMADLCEELGVEYVGVGWANNDAKAIGHEIARAGFHDTTDVTTLDVPADARARVENLCAALGIAEPRVMLVPGYE